MKCFDYLAIFLGIVFVIIPQVIRKYFLEMIDWVKEISNEQYNKFIGW